MSLKTIATNAIDEISGIAPVNSFIDNQNPTAVLAVALANRGGRSLTRKYKWQELIATASFTTVADTESYALDTIAPGFVSFAQEAQWDRSNFRRVRGPASAAEWQARKSRLVEPSQLNRRWRVQGRKFYISPVPTVTGDQIVFDYFTKNWVRPTQGDDKDGYTADTDVPLFDEELMTLDLKWRFLQAKGFPSEVEYREWDDMRQTILADDGGARVINMNGVYLNLTSNIPDTGYGL